MTDTLTDDASQFPAVAVPTGGDSRGSLGLRAGFQSLADRTAYLLALLTSVAKLRKGNVAAMQALIVGAGNDGECFFVPRQGLYVYEDGAADTVSAPWIYASAANTGRWVHVLTSLLDAKPGIASSNRTVSVQSLAFDGSSASIFNTSSLTFVDVTPMQLTVPACQVGDKLLIDLVPSFGIDTASLATTAAFATGRLVAHDGGSDSAITGTLISGGTDYNFNTAFRVTAIYTVANAGDVIIKAQLETSDATAPAVWVKPSMMRVRQIRP